MNGFIEIIMGTLGGGKTAFAAEKAYDHLKTGGYVYSNIEFYPEEIARRFLKEGLVFDPERLIRLGGNARQFHEQVGRGCADKLVMLIIDEAGLEMNARDWKNTDESQLAFNTMARKLDIWLVYISQDSVDVDKQIRRKADTIYVCRNMKKLKIFGVFPMPIPVYFRVRFNNTIGNGKPVKMDTEVVRKPSSFGIYNSDAMVGDVAQQFIGMKQIRGEPLKRISLEPTNGLTQKIGQGPAILCFFVACSLML